MIKAIAIAMTVAALSTGASAQAGCKGWNCGAELITTPSTTPPRATCSGWNCGPPELITPGTTPGTTPSTTPSAADNKNLLDGCVIDAIGKLPKVDGLRVTKSSTEFRNSLINPAFDFWTVSVWVDLQGRQATYTWLCRIYANREAQLLRAQ